MSEFSVVKTNSKYILVELMGWTGLRLGGRWFDELVIYKSLCLIPSPGKTSMSYICKNVSMHALDHLDNKRPHWAVSVKTSVI